MDSVLLRGIPDMIHLNSNFSPTFSFFGIIFFGVSKKPSLNRVKKTKEIRYNYVRKCIKIRA